MNPFFSEVTSTFLYLFSDFFAKFYNRNLANL